MFLQFLVPAGRAILEHDYISALDIGGANGLQPHWHRLLGNSIFYMFEPHEESYRQLIEAYKKDPLGSSYKLLPYAVAEKDGPTKFYATNARTGSSLLKPNKDWKFHWEGNPYFYPIQEIDINAVTLKTALDREDVSNVDLIKMDIQGPELAVLKGLDRERLNRTLLVEMEVLFEQDYVNSSKLSDVETFMHENDFELWDLRPCRYVPLVPAIKDTYNKKVFGVSDRDPSIAQKVCEVDCIYFRNSGPLLEKKDVSKLNKLVFTFCVYNFFGEAMRIVDEMQQRNIMTAERHKRVAEVIIQWQQLNKQGLKNLEAVLEHLGWQNYAQYTWVPFPSS